MRSRGTDERQDLGRIPNEILPRYIYPEICLSMYLFYHGITDRRFTKDDRRQR